METKIKLSVKDLNLYYGDNHALKNVSMDIYENKVTAFIGPSGCGKSTFLKTLNRMNDLVDDVKITGKVLLDGDDIYDQMIELPDDMLNNLEKTDFMFFYQIYLMSEKDSFFIDKDRIIIYPNFNKQGVFHNKECAIPLDKIDKIIYSNSYFTGKL